MIGLSHMRLPSLAAFHRTQTAHVRQVCEERRLSCGAAHYFRGAAGFDGSCFVTDFACEPGALPTALREIDEFFFAIGGCCSRITAALGETGESLDPGLISAGFLRRDLLCFARLGGQDGHDSKERVSNPTTASDVRILSARAMPRAYRRLLVENSQSQTEEARAVEFSIALDRLNDAQYESFVALRGDEPVGAAALHTVGDLGAMHGVNVVPSARRTGVGGQLVSRIMQTAKRWRLESVYVGISLDNEAAIGLAKSRGFARIGDVPRWIRESRS